MGNLCGKVDSDHAGPHGRTLGGPIPASVSTPANPKTVAAPRNNKVGGPPRTLGGRTAAAGAGEGSSSSSSRDDARKRAAAAAEVRNAPKSVGKLGSKLEAQRKESRLDTLKKASEAEVRRREMDATAEATSHN